MTDVEAKAPAKRGLSDQEGKKGFAKKPKLSPKQKNKTPNKLNNAQSNQKLKNVKKTGPENGSAKKLKPFSGTSEISATNKQDKLQKKVNKNAEGQNEEKRVKKSRRNVYVSLRSKLEAGEKDFVIKSLEEKIKDIEGRGELSKSAKKKLKLLRRIKYSAEGNKPVQQQTKSAPRGDGKKKALNAAASQKVMPKKAKLTAKVAEEEEDSADDAEEEESESGDDESGSEEQAEGEESSEEGEDEADSDDDEDGGEEESDEDESEDDSSPQSQENVSPKKELEIQKPKQIVGNQTKNSTTVSLEELKRKQIVGNNQKRFIVFVGNIPYDTNKQDLSNHFQKCGEIKHIRIPTDKKSSKPRGFAYVEVEDEERYQRCLSMHHTFLKGRRINVLYTQGGKKKDDDQKKEIKAKNFKLHAMRKEGKLAGSKKESQKRSFRRAKQRAFKRESQE